MIKTQLEELQSKDYRCYLTTLGLNKEAEAKEQNTTLDIKYIEIGRGKLPDNQSPVDVKNLIDGYGMEGRFKCSVKSDPQNPGAFIVQASIPADHSINGQSYEINEAACLLESGLVYAYRRVPTDFHLVTEGESKSYIIRMRFRTLNAEVVNFTIDQSILLATQEDLADEINKLKLDCQFLAYDEKRTYRTGEICTTIINEQLKIMQMYAGPNLTCKGIDPNNISNRHDGWEDSNAPFWWIEYKSEITGMPFFWIDKKAPEWAVMEIGADLPAVVYWRLSEIYPYLVNNGLINTGDIRGEFLRVLDQEKGLDPLRTINSKQLSSRHHYFERSNGGGARASSWGDAVAHISRTEGLSTKTLDSGNRGNLARDGMNTESVDIVSFDSVSRNVARAMAIAI